MLSDNVWFDLIRESKSTDGKILKNQIEGHIW